MNLSSWAEIVSPQQLVHHELPLFSSTVQAGFPSPANDYIEQKLDLNGFLIRHPSSTFFVKVKGTSMQEAGIYDGDILIVDRAVNAVNGHIVVAVLDGEFTVKRLKKEGSKVFLVPENPKFKRIEITQDRQFEIWGVVSWIIHKG